MNRTEEIHLTIPAIPPSVNMYVRHTRWGHYVTEEAKTFQTYVALAWAGAGFIPPKAKKYAVKIMLYLGTGKKLDVDNAPKVILDSLVRCQAIQSDAWVTRLVVEKQRDRKNPRTEIAVEYL